MSDDRGSSASRPIRDAERRLHLLDVPDEVSRRLRDAIRASLPTLAAGLVADTRDSGALVGVRGGAATAWTMSFRAGPCDIVLDLVPQRGAVHLTGQLLCPEPTPGTAVRVFCVDELVTATTTDDFGQFDVGALAPAEYTVVAVRPEHHVIELDLDLRGAP